MNVAVEEVLGGPVSNPDEVSRSVFIVNLAALKSGLRTAMATGDLDRLVGWRTKARAMETLVAQLKLGGDVAADVAESTRRAERAIGQAVRAGQAQGWIRRKGHGGGPADPFLRNGKMVPVSVTGRKDKEMISPATYIRNGGMEVRDHYWMADVPDDVFEAVLSAAREENNLTRTNVGRKCRAALESLPPPSADAKPPVRKTAAGRKAMEALVIGANSLAFLCDDTDPAEVDVANHDEDIKEILRAMKVIRAFIGKVEDQR